MLMRRKTIPAPLIIIAHSLGGLVVKQVMLQWGDMFYVKYSY